MIRKLPNGAGYAVYSEDGKRLGGPYPSRQQAARRLAQIEYFKHGGKPASEGGAKASTFHK